MKLYYTVASVMDISVWTDCVIIILLILFNGFFSAAEMAVVTLNSNKIRKEAEEGHDVSIRLLRFIEDKSGFLATIQVAITLASLLSSAFGATRIAPILYRAIDPEGLRPILEPVSTVVITLLIAILSLVLGELIPKRIGLTYPEKFSQLFVGVLRFFDFIFRPMATLLTWLANGICQLLGLPQDTDDYRVSEEEIRLLAEVGSDSGVIQTDEAEMINNIFELNDTEVSEIMTPRTGMVSLSLDADYDEVMNVAANESYSRIPVYGEDIDDIVGILHIKDLLKIKPDQSKHFQLKDLLHEAYFVPETKSVNLLIREMQNRKLSLAIVVDEYGGTDGLITVEDILEEIVGEIDDEYDDNTPDITQLSDGSYIIDGLLSPEEVGKYVPEIDELEDDDSYDTIAGFVLSLLERIPKPDEHPEVAFKDLVFTVLEMDDRRIAKIKVSKNDSAPSNQVEGQD